MDIAAIFDKVLQELKLHRSEEHTSELQSLTNLVCRLLLEKKKILLLLMLLCRVLRDCWSHHGFGITVRVGVFSSTELITSRLVNRPVGRTCSHDQRYAQLQ